MKANLGLPKEPRESRHDPSGLQLLADGEPHLLFGGGPATPKENGGSFHGHRRLERRRPRERRGEGREREGGPCDLGAKWSPHAQFGISSIEPEACKGFME